MTRCSREVPTGDRGFAEALIDREDDPAARAVVVGMLRTIKKDSR